MNPILGNQNNDKYNNYNINQSLYNNNFNSNSVRDFNKYNNSKKADITVVIRVLAILLIIFGLCVIGESVYALNSEENRLKDNPQVSTEKMGKEVTIKIVTEKPIKEFRYRWNEGENTIISGNSTVINEKTIDIPNGNNILKISVIDFWGNRTEYYKQYIYESSDVNKPKIDIAITGNKLKITASDDNKISYMAYKWNEDEENRIDADMNENQKELSQEIEVLSGQNELTIIAVDGEENKETRHETIIGDKKPEIYLSTDGDNIVITAKDDEEITKIEVDVDGQTQDSGEESLSKKEVTAKIKIGPGDHSVKITVTNINGLQTTKEVTASI